MSMLLSLIPGMAPTKPVIVSLPGYSPFESYQLRDETLTQVTPLIYMVINAHIYDTSTIRDYIKGHPRQLNMRNKHGYNPLSAACLGYPERTSLDVVKLLLESGAEIGTYFRVSNCCGNARLMSPLSNQLLLALEASNPDPALIGLLLEHSKGLVADHDTDLRVIMSAIDTKSIEIVSLFIDAGFDINSINKTLSPLIRAIRNRDACMVRFLLERGANPNITVWDDDMCGFSYTAFAELASMSDCTATREMLTILFDEPGRTEDTEAHVESVV